MSVTTPMYFRLKRMMYMYHKGDYVIQMSTLIFDKFEYYPKLWCQFYNVFFLCVCVRVYLKKNPDISIVLLVNHNGYTTKSQSLAYLLTLRG